MSLSRYINNFYKEKTMVCCPQQQNIRVCGSSSLVSSNTVVCELPARVLQNSSDKVDPRILLGFKFSILGFL